jgi:hypothetical protein
VANSTAERIEDPAIDPARHRLPKARRPITLWDVMIAPLRLILRVLRPKLVDRYVMGELLAPFAFGMVLFLVLFVTSFNLFKLAQMAARGAPVQDVMEMLGLRCVQALVYFDSYWRTRCRSAFSLALRDWGCRSTSCHPSASGCR